ncbi:hypothetical protein L7F22_067088 [Adiantum nelumboides]|nr:hypothetical protein [Adiantum nelumboides]
MSAKGNGYFIILGCPWLIQMRALRDWETGRLICRNDIHKRIVYNMKEQRQEDIQVVSTPSDTEEEFSTTASEEEDSDITTEEDSSMEVMGIRLRPVNKEQASQVEEEAKEQPQESNEEMIKGMLSKTLTQGERVEYKQMLQKFPNLFVKDYINVRGVDIVQHQIELKPESQSRAQKLRRLGAVKEEALLKEVRKLLSAGFIYPVDNFGSYLLTKPFVILTSENLLPWVSSQMTMSPRISKWLMELQSYEYTFKVENSMRAQLARILTYRLHEKVIKVPKVGPLPPPPPKVLSNVYTLFFDGAFRRATGKAGGGLVLVNPEGEVVMKEQVTVDGSTSNNEVEYDVLISGLKICLAQKIQRLMVKGDALLIMFNIGVEAVIIAKLMATKGYCTVHDRQSSGIDAMGPLPRTGNGKLYILVAIDYMTRPLGLALVVPPLVGLGTLAFQALMAAKCASGSLLDGFEKWKQEIPLLLFLCLELQFVVFEVPNRL